MFIQEHSKEHAIARLCEALEVSESGFYGWRDRDPSKREIDNIRLVRLIEKFHRASGEIYGSPKIHADLLDDGVSCSKNKVARLMQRHGIQSKLRRKFVITTDSKSTHSPSPDLLKRNFQVNEPDTHWVSDTTFIQTRQGWVYLAVIVDLFSRAVVGWSMGNKNDAQLVCEALKNAVLCRQPKPGLILHSDQGSTYASSKYQALVKENKLICSMARKGECLDNAVAESFFGSLKNEWVYHEDYKTRTEARQSVFKYIEVFYNRKRRHAFLDYKAPFEFEQCAA